MKYVDPQLVEQMEKSPCFGLAHDAREKDCRRCDLQQECAARTKVRATEGLNMEKRLNPKTEEFMKEARGHKDNVVNLDDHRNKDEDKNENKKKNNLPEGMPDTRGMTVEELRELLEKRGGTCKEYSSEKIQKMRLVMAIKETYK